MSQAYGTLDNYGAYGFFVKKSDKKRKTCCGSPDCPYTAFYGPPDELPEGEDMPPTPTINEVLSKPRKCQCKNCKKQNGSNGSKNSSKNSTCASPNCPKKTPTSGVPCPYRQSAGADDWNYKPCCKSQACPFSSGSGGGRQSSARQGGPCGGGICPAKPGDCLGPSCNMDSCEEENNTQCGGRQCPFQSNGGPGECPIGTCPHTGCGKGGRRKSRASEQPTEMLDELNSFLDKTASVSEKKKNCRDKTCPYYEEGEGEDELTKNCEDVTCPANQEKGSSREFEEHYGLCAGQVCPLSKKLDDSMGDVPEGTTAKHKKKLSLLLNEDGQKMLLGKDDQKDIFANMTESDQSNMVLMISRLLEERQRSHSLNNYYNPDLSLSMQNFVSTMKLRSFDSGKTGHIDEDSDEKTPKDKKKRKGPCSQDSCKSLKYKRCSECGGISKSGATCDNTEVSFSTISYDSVTTTGAGDQTMITKTKAPEKKAQPDKKKNIKEDLVVKIAKTKKKNSRFVYTGGEAYPGVRLGHKTCVYVSKNVPAHMGWLWNIKKEGEKRKRKKKWKPGYLRAEIEEAIIANRRQKGIPDPPELKMLVRKTKNRNAAYESDSEEEEVIPKPTLIIQKKDGNYLITMHPLKDPKKLEDREDPYMRCKPIQFVITKPPKKDPIVPDINGFDEMEGEYEDEDFENFYKNSCYCDGDPNLDSNSSSESELNIEFTTPAGIIIPERFKKPPNVVNVDTQFKDADFQCNDCPIIVPKKFKKERSPRKKKVG